MINRANHRLGKNPPRIDPRTLRKANYDINPQRAKIVVPSADGYLQKVPSWPMYLNDRLGDCVAAAAGHCQEQWSAYGGKNLVPSNDEILTFYESQGYVPGDPSTDNGMVMLDALNYWRKTGLGGKKIQAYMSLDPWDPQQIMEAIYLFGNIFIGLSLPVSAQTDPVWEVPKTGLTGNGEPGSWGGHCVMVPGYRNVIDPHNGHGPGLMVVSWGELIPMTWAFLYEYCDEAYAILDSDWVGVDGTAANLLDIKQLEADLMLITA